MKKIVIALVGSLLATPIIHTESLSNILQTSNVQDVLKQLAQIADEAKNLSDFAQKYGFIHADGSINTQEMNATLLNLDQQITRRIESLPLAQRSNLSHLRELHIGSLKSAFGRYVQTITPTKQIISTPLEENVRTLITMASLAKDIPQLAQRYGYLNPDGSVNPQLLSDAIIKIEQQIKEDAAKISPAKLDETNKIITQHLESLRKNIEQYKIAHPKIIAPPAPAQSAQPLSTIVPTAQLGGPPLPSPAEAIKKEQEQKQQEIKKEEQNKQEQLIAELKKLTLPPEGDVKGITKALQEKFSNNDQDAAITMLSAKPNGATGDDKILLEKLLIAKTTRTTGTALEQLNDQIKKLQEKK